MPGLGVRAGLVCVLGPGYIAQLRFSGALPSPALSRPAMYAEKGEFEALVASTIRSGLGCKAKIVIDVVSDP